MQLVFPNALCGLHVVQIREHHVPLQISLHESRDAVIALCVLCALQVPLLVLALMQFVFDNAQHEVLSDLKVEFLSLKLLMHQHLNSDESQAFPMQTLRILLLHLYGQLFVPKCDVLLAQHINRKQPS